VRVGLTLLTIALLSTLRGPVSLVGFLDGCLTYSALLRRHPPTVPPAHPPTYLAHMPLSSTFSLTHLSPRHHHALNNHHIFQFNSTLSGHRSPPSHLRPTYRDLHRLLPRQQAYRKPTTGTASEEAVRKTIEGARELQYEWAAGIPVSGIAYQLLEQQQLRSGAKPSRRCPLPTRCRIGSTSLTTHLQDLVTRETRIRGEKEGVYVHFLVLYQLLLVLTFLARLSCPKPRRSPDGITHSSWLVSSISRIPITEEDAGFLTEDLHRGRSCVPPYNIPSRPVLVRWDPSTQVSLQSSLTEDLLMTDCVSPLTHPSSCPLSYLAARLHTLLTFYYSYLSSHSAMSHSWRKSTPTGTSARCLTSGGVAWCSREASSRVNQMVSEDQSHTRCAVLQRGRARDAAFCRCVACATHPLGIHVLLNNATVSHAIAARDQVMFILKLASSVPSISMIPYADLYAHRHCRTTTPPDAHSRRFVLNIDPSHCIEDEIGDYDIARGDVGHGGGQAHGRSCAGSGRDAEMGVVKAFHYK